jgi:hypothetical protein
LITTKLKPQMADDGVDLAGPRHDFGRDHLGTSAVLGLGGQDEPRVVRVSSVLGAVVVIDPRGEPGTEPLDERPRDFVESAPRGFGRERDVEHDHATPQLASFGQLPRRGEGELGKGHVT